MMKSIGNILDTNKGIGPGFDFLRVFLAISIVLFHTGTVTDQYYGDDTPVWMIHYILVPMFFALSGFLVSASAGRSNLKNFLINRGIRIIPALAIDTLVCMLLIGPLFTMVPLESYFESKEFASYTLNMIGWVHFTLPGVFTDQPFNRVNGSLWTIPFELACYGIISALIIAKMIRGRYFVLALVLGYIACSIVVYHFGIASVFASSKVSKGISVVFVEYEAQSVTAFLCGIVAYQNRHVVRYSWTIFTLCVLSLFGIAFALTNAQGQLPAMRLLLMPMITYVTVFIGLTPVPLPAFFRKGDYSYGIYLYHQPFLQIVVALFPALALAPHYGYLFTFVAGLPLVIGMAFLSWHLVEKPALSIRKQYSLAAKRQLAEQQSKSENSFGGRTTAEATARAL